MTQEFEIYLPLSLGQSKIIPKKFIEKIKKELVSQFGGVTDTRHHNVGLWKLGGVTYQDDILILKVLAAKKDNPLPFMDSLKRRIEKELKQKNVLIVIKNVRLI